MNTRAARCFNLTLRTAFAILHAMNFPVFFSTFCMIFLAEVGDKTMFAVMAQSANNASRWSVFFAAVAALTLTTALGMLAGAVLNRYLSPRVLKIAAGVLFLVFGAFMLREAFTMPDAPAAQHESQ